MAIVTVAEVKQYLNISDLPNLTLTGDTTSTGIIITNISTIGLKPGDTITGTPITTSTGVTITSIISPTSLQISQPAIATSTGAILTISNRNSMYDTMIALYEPVVEEYILQYTNNTFKDSTGTVVYPATIKQVASKMIWLHINSAKSGSFGVKSESLGNHSVTYSDTTDFGADILNTLKQYRKIRVL